jgi:hypothetical protein
MRKWVWRELRNNLKRMRKTRRRNMYKFQFLRSRKENLDSMISFVDSNPQCNKYYYLMLREER